MQAICHVVTGSLHPQIPVQNLGLDQQAAATPTHQTSRMYCQWLQSTCASGLWYRLRMTPERPAMMTAYQCVMQTSVAMPVGVSQLFMPQPAASLCIQCSCHERSNTKLDKTGLCAHEQSAGGCRSISHGVDRRKSAWCYSFSSCKLSAS